MKERIQKVLANFGVDSRRNIEEMIRQGRVAVNGTVKTRLPILIDPEEDHVTVDDEPVKLAKTRKGKSPVQKLYFLLNKPKDVYSTNVAQGEQTLAKDLLPRNLPTRVYPVGRLDADSRGLLLLTNDGELTNLLTHPRYEVPKTYRARIDGYVADDAVKKLREGIWLADKEGKGFKTAPCKVQIVRRSNQESILELTLREGRNRQVRRMLAKVEYKVRDLARVKLGPLSIEGLSSGKFRPLTEREVKQLYALAKAGEKRSEERKPTAPAPLPEPKGRQADLRKDLAAEFEDDELRREAAGETGEPSGVAADGLDGEGAPNIFAVPAKSAKAAPSKPKPRPAAKTTAAGDVDFVELSAAEQAELEAEAAAFTQTVRQREGRPVGVDALPDDESAFRDETEIVDVTDADDDLGE